MNFIVLKAQQLWDQTKVPNILLKNEGGNYL